MVSHAHLAVRVMSNFLRLPLSCNAAFFVHVPSRQECEWLLSPSRYLPDSDRTHVFCVVSFICVSLNCSAISGARENPMLLSQIFFFQIMTIPIFMVLIITFIYNFNIFNMHPHQAQYLPVFNFARKIHI